MLNKSVINIADVDFVYLMFKDRKLNLKLFLCLNLNLLLPYTQSVEVSC